MSQSQFKAVSLLVSIDDISIYIIKQLNKPENYGQRKRRSQNNLWYDSGNAKMVSEQFETMQVAGEQHAPEKLHSAGTERSACPINQFARCSDRNPTLLIPSSENISITSFDSLPTAKQPSAGANGSVPIQSPPRGLLRIAAAHTIKEVLPRIEGSI